MGLFKKLEQDKQDIKAVKKLTEKNARELARVEGQDLRKIKARQDDIERRLALLQKEYDVQTVQHRKL